MELAIGFGLAAIGYGLSSMFPRNQNDDLIENEIETPQGGEGETLAPTDTYGQVIQSEETYPYDFKERVKTIDPRYEPDEIRAANDDLSDLHPGTLGVQTKQQPFFPKQPGTMNEPMLQTKLSVHTGIKNAAWNPKTEIEPMNAPAEVGHVNGAPVDLEIHRAYYTDVLNRNPVFNNVGPTERVNVGPGLGLDPTVPAANGFHDPTRILPADLGYKMNQFGGRVIVGRALQDKPTQNSTLGIYRRDNIESTIDGYEGIATHRAKSHHPHNQRYTIQEDGNRNNLSKKGLQHNETGVMDRSSGNVLPGHLGSGFEEILTNRDMTSDFTAPAKGLDRQENSKIGTANTTLRPSSDYGGIPRGPDGIRDKQGTHVRDRQDYRPFEFDHSLASVQLKTNEVAIRPLHELAA